MYLLISPSKIGPPYFELPVSGLVLLTRLTWEYVSTNDCAVIVRTQLRTSDDEFVSIFQGGYGRLHHRSDCEGGTLPWGVQYAHTVVALYMENVAVPGSRARYLGHYHEEEPWEGSNCYFLLSVLFKSIERSLLPFITVYLFASSSHLTFAVCSLPLIEISAL